MKKTQRNSNRKILSLFVVMTMLASMLSMGITVQAAPTTPTLTHDAVTVDNWEDLFPSNSTKNAGGVWTDKSVVSGADDTLDAIRGQKADAGEFLVGLSAVGSALDLHEGSSTPTDTVFVLDSSSSMDGSPRTELNTAVNAAIDKLMSLNPLNRVAVVYYSGSATTLLELGHYTQTSSSYPANNKYITVTNRTSSNDTYAATSGLQKDGVAYTESYNTTGGTNQQSGMLSALNIFESQSAEAKAGNIPVMVVMTDGEASQASANYTLGQNNMSNSQGSRTTFLTQLTASYVENRMETVYTKPFHFYTMGFYPGSTGNIQMLAKLLMNPDVNKTNPSNNASVETVLDYWDTYNSASNGATVEIDGYDVVKTAGLDMNYVDEDGAFESTDATGLTAAFDEIYQMIEEVSAVEYVTQVDPMHGDDLSGYVKFIDNIGKHMKVDEIRGIMIGGQLYSGVNFAQDFLDPTSIFGSIDNPTTLGDDLVISIRTRLGLMANEADKPAANIRTYALIYNAYNSHQLSYTNINSFSNYFGWYSDGNFNCMGPWDDKADPDGTDYTNAMETVYPTTNTKYKDLGYSGDGTTPPTYVNKSYLFIGDGVHDAMYISVRVSRNIATGEEIVAFSVPASMIPIIRYKVRDIDGATTMEYNTDNESPITLFYEIKPGLNSDTLALAEAGKTEFYTNAYNKDFETGLDVSHKIDKGDVDVNTYSYFEPNSENRKYYFEENKDVYYKDATTNEWKVYTGDETWAAGNSTDSVYSYKEDVYVVDGSGNVTKETQYFPLNNHTLLGGHTDTPNGETALSEYAATRKTDGSNEWYIPKGAIHRHMNHYLNPKGSNTTGTLANYNIPFVDDIEGQANKVHAYSVLGNNGKSTITPDNTKGAILLKKEFKAGIEDTIAGFEFTLSVADIGTDTIYMYKPSNSNTAAELIGELKFTNNEGSPDTATVTLKAGESVYISGFENGKAVTITENVHPAYTPEKIVVGVTEYGPTDFPIPPVTAEGGEYETVTFINAEKPDTVPLLINYLNDAYKDDIEDCTFTVSVDHDDSQHEAQHLIAANNYNNAIKAISSTADDEILKYYFYDYDYVPGTSEHIINHISQFKVIDGQNGIIQTGDKYIQTGYTIIEDGTDPSLGIVINIYYALDVLDDYDNNETDGDEIPDKYQAVVKFKSIDDHTELTLRPSVTPTGSVSGVTTQVFTLKDINGDYATSGDVTPVIKNEATDTVYVTTTPEENYAFDYWTKDSGTVRIDNPEETIVMTAGTTITFYANFAPDTIEGGDDIPDTHQAVVKFHANANGIVAGVGQTQIFTFANHATSGDVTPSLDYLEVTPNEGYTFDRWTSDAAGAVVVNDPEATISNVSAGTTIDFYVNFVPDVFDDEDDNITDGDNVADKYQAAVQFVSENVAKGTVTGTGTTQVFTFPDNETHGQIQPDMTNVNVAPVANYQFDYWTLTKNGAEIDLVTPGVLMNAEGNDLFVYTAHFAYIGGGGGGGGGTSNGTIEIEKIVDAPSDLDAESMEFTFTVYEGTSEAGKVKKTLKVKANSSEKITLPAGTYYIAENDGDVVGYILRTECSESGNKVVVKRGEKEKITFKNIYTPKNELLEKDDHHAYIIGYPDGDVRPNAGITRAEVATIFFRMMTDDAREVFGRNENPFSDVSKSDWFNIAISTLHNAKILDGYLDGTFKPDEPITRAELSKIAASFYKAQVDKTVKFSDINGHWAEKFIESAYSYGFINGYPDGTFKPDQYITRAETMKIVNATLERAPHKDYLHDDMIKWPDNSNKDEWYYADVQEATNSHDYDKKSGNEIWTKILPVRDWAALEITE